MNVSAQARYLDYSVRPLYAKGKRRSSDDVLKRRVVERPEDDRSDDAEASAPQVELDDDDDGLGYSRQLPPRAVAAIARKDMIAETVRPAPAQNTAALLTLLNVGDGRSRGTDTSTAAPASSRGDSFYDLLDQVIAQA